MLQIKHLFVIEELSIVTGQNNSIKHKVQKEKQTNTQFIVLS
jgi:hypothetical protein